jgi:LL-diaminopimelate aminotransferase
MIQTATRLNGINEYYFSQKLREIDAMNKAGKNIINLGIGSPDLPPHPDVIKVLNEESIKPNVHAYQNYKGSPVLRNAMAQWYSKWYGVSLDADSEILPLIGSKEGIMHICMTYLNAGDLALIPNPGYPTYRSALALAGGTAVEYLLEESHDWFPNFVAIEETLSALKTNNGGTCKLMFVNYPHMPTGQLPIKEKMAELIAFAKKHNILLVHDNPYSFILNEDPFSLLSIPGAKGVTIELNSLSKSHNMAGWRIGMLCGDKERINEVLKFKSNMDSGMFLPVQLAAAKALTLGEEWHRAINKTYHQRREKVFELLDMLQCNFSTTQAGMFVWAKIPAGYKDGFSLSDEVLRNAHVFITPGGIFGSSGNNYVRVSLCSTEEKIQEAISRINSAKG